MPQDLYAQIASQYKLASRLLNSKDEIIRQFQSDLKGKDEEYVELLALHQDDLLQMCRQMRTHFQTYLSATQHQLAEIENRVPAGANRAAEQEQRGAGNAVREAEKTRAVDTGESSGRESRNTWRSWRRFALATRRTTRR